MAEERRKEDSTGDGDAEAPFDPAHEGNADPRLPTPILEPAEGEASDEPAEETGSGDEPDELDESVDEDDLPKQFGHRRYVYAAFFVFAIVAAYLLQKLGMAGWHRLSQWTPKVGEPREDLVTPTAAIIGAVGMILTYRRTDVRNLSDEVALELSKVEWPSKAKVRRFTTIVVVASLSSSMVFWLYDIFANKATTFLITSSHPILYGIGAGVFIYLVRLFGIRVLAGKA